MLATKHNVRLKMRMRRFIFCDKCNPQGINTYDVDRNDTHKEEGHSWYEGTLDEAIKLGWQLSEQGEVLCPHCVENGRETSCCAG